MFYPVLYACAAAATAVITAIIAHFLIPVLRRHKMGQKILEIGPQWHKSKEGTPTMCGLSFMAASVAVGVISCVLVAVKIGVSHTSGMIMTLAMALASGLIGVIDDRAKLRKKQNEGLTAPQKYLLQLVLSGLYLFGMTLYGGLKTELYIPFWGHTVELGIWYYVVAILLLTGVMNSVNLTDGIDGLACTVTLVLSLFYAACALVRGENAGLTVISALVSGSTLGFLVYNAYPAKAFMGDTGSLFLGGLAVGGAFMMNKPLVVLVCGLWYVAEAASVILQVGYFKLTGGKRLFKMAPLHHHFEKCGWSERKIVAVASVFTALVCIAAWFA